MQNQRESQHCKRNLTRAIQRFMNMKAIKVESFGGPEVLKVCDVPIPQPAEDEVLVRIKAVGINPVDTYLRTGTHTIKPPLPYTPGSDGAGLVEKAGAAVTKFKAGDRVFVSGTVTGSYAEYATVKASTTHPLPALLNFKQGAALGVPHFTAYRALFIRGNIQAGQTLLIHGASGAVGNGCIQFAKAHGLTVFGTAGSQQGLDLIKKLGVDQAFNHREEGYEKKIMAASNGTGVDYVAEMLSNVNLQKDLDLLAHGGTVLLIGSRGDINISPRSLMTKETKMIGVMLPRSTKEEMALISSEVVKGAEAGHLAPVIAREYTLAEAGQAHQDIINTTSAAGKLVLVT